MNNFLKIGFSQEFTCCRRSRWENLITQRIKKGGPEKNPHGNLFNCKHKHSESGKIIRSVTCDTWMRGKMAVR